jgi:Dolichyl-phosphate-mannose-protein mannosyltransferase
VAVADVEGFVPEVDARPEAVRSRAIVFEGAAAALITAILYLVTLAGNHSETEDTIPFAVRLRDHPHSDAPHLLYDWFSWVAFHLARGLGITDDPLRPAQVKNALFGAAAVGILWWLVRHAGRSRVVAATACGILAFSYGFWWNNVEGDVYAVSSFFILICLALAYRAVERPSTRSFALLGAANGVAVLMHTVNVFFAGVAAVALWLAWRDQRLQRVARAGAAYAVTASAIVIPAYAIAAAILHLGSIHAFREWFTRTTGDGQFGHVNAAMFEKGVIGAGRALIGGHSTLSFGFAKTSVEKHFPDKPLREEYYFLRGYSHGLAVVVLVLSVIAVLGLLVLVVSWLRRPELDRRGRTLAALCLAWLLAYLPIELYWDPFNIELWYVAWIPAAVLLALPLGDRRLLPRSNARTLATVTLGSLLLANLLGSVWPQHDGSKDYWRVRAAWYRANTSPSDVVLASGYLQSAYLRYLTKADVVDTDSVFADSSDESAAIASIRQNLNQLHPRHIYVSSEVFDPYADTSAGCPRVDPTVCAEAVRLRNAFLPDSTPIAQLPNERVWELRLPGSAASA